MRITVSTQVSAPIEEVWHAYTHPEEIKQWNAASDDWHTTDAKVDLREGGLFSRVDFSVGAKEVTVTVSFDGETTHSEEQQRSGWQAILANFKQHVEKGGRR